MDFLFFLAVFAHYSEGHQLFAISNFGVSVSTLSIGILFAILFFRLIFTNDQLKIYPTTSIKFFCFLAISVLLSGLYPLLIGNRDVIVQYFKTAAHYYFLAGFVFICFAYKIKNVVWTKVFRAWIISSFVVNLYAIYQLIARALGWPFAWIQPNNISLHMRNTLQLDEFKQVTTQFENFFRASSFFSEPSALAFFNITILVTLIVPFIQSQTHFFKSKLITVAAFILSIIALLLAFSLTGVLCLITFLITVCLIENRKYLRNLLGILLVAIILVFATDSVVENYTGTSVVNLFEERISGIVKGGTNQSKQQTGESFTDRLTSGMQAVKIWTKSPITGVGLGSYQYWPESEYAFVDFTSLSALAETGILGFIAFTGMMMFLVKDSYRLRKYATKTENPEDSRLQGLIIYIIMIWFTCAYTTLNQFVGTGLWVSIGMALSIHRNSHKILEKSNT